VRFAPDCATTPEPAEEELRVIRAIDPTGFWTK
jgi:hypothetical protein